MTLLVDEKVCDERAALDDLVIALEDRGVRAYTPTECLPCDLHCDACGCESPRLFLVRIEPGQLDLAQSAGWTASSWMAKASCGDPATAFECPY